ncbi:protein FAR1-RELATED SEQUENCE 5-like [Helianthus annuus]|uniref:protein FAR1-RELATED SEQUENCE 5-like n=1 Tax=Helianthus annuus TaxID=4232 RepID=UPI000B9030F7|nr:protein FAR1-RELATED SEQUENCE 5-like [Helianthus annuus]
MDPQSSTGRANVDVEESRPISDHAQLSAYQRVSIEDVLNPLSANPNPIASSSSLNDCFNDDIHMLPAYRQLSDVQEEMADGLCKLNYMEFGDVISFDATFKTNRYKMVFVPFTGIDKHCRNVTLGVGLLASESIESYKWLLNSFLKSFGQQPKVVVTDQDPAMKQAIEEVFPISRHRLCMWHIMKKWQIRRMCDIVWTDSIEPEEFERQGKLVMIEFGLIENKWIDDMFVMRSMWIPDFYRHEPMSGLMRTTSRSESENHFFCQVANSQLTLVEFMNHFDGAMDVQRFNHRKNDHISRYAEPADWSETTLEKDAAKRFARSIFFDQQIEIYGTISECLPMETKIEGPHIKIMLKDFKAHGDGLLEVL